MSGPNRASEPTAVGGLPSAVQLQRWKATTPETFRSEWHHSPALRWRAQFISALLILSATVCAAEDTSRSGPLFDELARMDKALFDAAFVNCDAGKFRALFTDDAEFYHDRTGLAVGEAARTMKSCPRDNGVTRTLVADSLEVYPMQGYGAIQIGRHVFARKGEPGAEAAKFVHLWKRDPDGAWRLARVLSFDHRPAGQQP